MRMRKAIEFLPLLAMIYEAAGKRVRNVNEFFPLLTRCLRNGL